jgi:hypothetical protein
MFWKRKKPGMNPNSAHLISFALEVGMDEVDHLIEVANERGLSSASERLGQHRDALAKMHAEFSVTSENLQAMANQTDAIAADVAEIEQVLEVSENDQSFHVALATSYLATAAKIARGEL